MYLICDMTSQSHLIMGSCEYMGGSPLWYITTLIRLPIISIVTVDKFLNLPRDLS